MLTAFYQFSEEAPSIMQTFIRNGDACDEVNADALRLVSQNYDHLHDTPLRQYNEISTKLGEQDTVDIL